jgi:hypothetical protein
VIRMDATIQIAHSDKEGAAGTFKGSWGHHPLTAWCDNTGAAPRGVAVSDGGEMTLVVPPS